MIIRKAVNSDAAQLANVHVKTWQVAYKNEIQAGIINPPDQDSRLIMWNDILAKQKSSVIVLEDEDTIKGFISFGNSRDADSMSDDIVEIYAMYILPEVWRSGWGTRLFNHALEKISQQKVTEINLWVLEKNIQARKFYEAMGFSLSNTEKENPRFGNNLKEIRYSLTVA